MNEAPIQSAEREGIHSPAPGGRVTLSWFQFLLLLLIPGLGLIALNVQQSLNGTALQRQQHETALYVASEQQQEKWLSDYIAQMSDLLAHDHLLDGKITDPARLIADARTHEVLRNLDANRKATVLRFLYATKLINNDHRNVTMAETNLHNAYLAEIDLRDTDLSGADFSGADLHKANLTFTVLVFTDLSGANLRGADFQAGDMHNTNLHGADLSGANLKDVVGLSNDQLAQVKSLVGAIMPDGSKHG